MYSHRKRGVSTIPMILGKQAQKAHPAARFQWKLHEIATQIGSLQNDPPQLERLLCFLAFYMIYKQI